MSNTINITVSLSEKDRRQLEVLISSITGLASVLGSALPKDVQQKVIQETDEICRQDQNRVNAAEEHPITESTAHLEPVEETHNEPAAPAPEPIPEVKPVSFAEFQAAVTRVVAKGPEQKKAAKEIINKYGASVSAVPEDKRAEAMAELAKI